MQGLCKCSATDFISDISVAAPNKAKTILFCMRSSVCVGTSHAGRRKELLHVPFFSVCRRRGHGACPHVQQHRQHPVVTKTAFFSGDLSRQSTNYCVDLIDTLARCLSGVYLFADAVVFRNANTDDVNNGPSSDVAGQMRLPGIVSGHKFCGLSAASFI